MTTIKYCCFVDVMCTDQCMAWDKEKQTCKIIKTLEQIAEGRITRLENDVFNLRKDMEKWELYVEITNKQISNIWKEIEQLKK